MQPLLRGSAAALDAFGVDYIEMTSPAASEQSRLDLITICQLNLKVRAPMPVTATSSTNKVPRPKS